MVEQFLQIMIDGLSQKIVILDKIIEYSELQQKLVEKNPVDWDAFDKTIEDKAVLIEKINQIDDGFTSVFERIKDEVNDNKDQYKDYIQKLQNNIKLTTEKSTALIALEERTRAKVTTVFSDEKAKLRQNKATNSAANNYYKNMSKINYIDSQLMDQKK